MPHTPPSITTGLVTVHTYADLEVFVSGGGGEGEGYLRFQTGKKSDGKLRDAQ